jgi:hypothetical protein
MGILPTMSELMKFSQVIQPYEFGHDASKATCLWLKNLPLLEGTKYVEPRLVDGKPRWANQTDSGQNKLGPSPTRSADRARTYAGIAEAMAAQWSKAVSAKSSGTLFEWKPNDQEETSGPTANSTGSLQSCSASDIREGSEAGVGWIKRGRKGIWKDVYRVGHGHSVAGGATSEGQEVTRLFDIVKQLYERDRMTIRVTVKNEDANESRVIAAKTQNLDGTPVTGVSDKTLKGGESAELWVHSGQKLAVEEVAG